MPPNKRAVCLVLHDVAPSTWPACDRFLRAVDALGPIPATLLVVPEYHHGAPIDAVPEFVHAIERRLGRGDEVAMHGCFHWDDLPVRGPWQWLRRRVYTAGEGEFAALGAAAARARLARGIAVFRRLGWPLQGFVAPAWLLSEGTRTALAGFPFSYTSTHRRFYALPNWQPHAAPSLVWSVRSGARRRACGVFNRFLLHRLHSVPLLRLGVHPVDVAHPEVFAFWLAALRASLATRAPTTKAAWLAGQAPELVAR